jgi:hypothetical protein
VAPICRRDAAQPQCFCERHDRRIHEPKLQI